MGGSREELQAKTRDELYEKAQEKDVEGRSTMTKDELVDALSHGESETPDQAQDDIVEQMKGEAINVPDEARGELAGITPPDEQTEESQDTISAEVGQGSVTPAGTGTAAGAPVGGAAPTTTTPTTTPAGGTRAPVPPATTAAPPTTPGVPPAGRRL